LEVRKLHKDILMWIQDGNVVKGEVNFETGTVTFYDKLNNILLERSGLTFKQLNRIKQQIQKQLDKRKHVGYYYV